MICGVYLRKKRMSDSDSYYIAYLILAGIGTAFAAWDCFYISGNKGIRKIRWVGIAILIFISCSIYCSNKQRSLDKIEKDTIDSTNKANYGHLSVTLNDARDSLVTLGEDLRDIKQALKDSNLTYDSVDKKISHISVNNNSGIIMPNASFRGNTLVGNNSKQNNSSK